MPAKSPAQYVWLKHNKPALFRKWKEKYKQGTRRMFAKFARKRKSTVD